MLSEGKVGAFKRGPGVQGEMRIGKYGDVVTNSFAGKYSELSRDGKVFFAANSADQALSALSATATGVILSNPVGSDKDFVLLEVSFTQNTAAAAEAGQSVILAYGAYSQTEVTHTTALTVRSVYGGLVGGTGRADSAATLPAAPVLFTALWQPTVSATATTAVPPVVVYRPEGLLVVPPGCSVSLQNGADATLAITGRGAFVWAELER